MTNEEAIKIIASYNYYNIEDIPDNVDEAFDLAIKALKEQDRPQIVLFTENITEEEKQKLIAEIKSVMDNAKFTAEPERPQGEWIKWTFKTFGAMGDWEYKCSKCEKVYGGEFNFCPNCGLKMKKGGTENDTQD